MNKIKKDYYKLLPYIHFIITFFTDHLFFKFGDNFHWITFSISKAVSFFIILFFWNAIFKIFKEKSEKYRGIFKCSLIYFLFLFAIFLLVYPGIWVFDDLGFLELAAIGDWMYYLNYLTSIFYVSSLIIIPLPIGVPIMMIILSSITVGYIVYKLKTLFNLNKLYLLIYVPFLLPITVLYNMYPNRPLIYGLVYLLFFSFLIFKFLESKKLNNKEVIISLIVLAILSYWRTEGIYLLLFGPIFIFLIQKGKFRDCLKYFLIILCIFIALKIPETLANKSTELYKERRILPSVINPLSYMLTQDLIGDDLEEDLEKINKVLDIELMKQYPSLTNVDSVWLSGDKVIKKFNYNDFQLFKKAYLNIVKNNYKLYLECKFKTFLLASGYNQYSLKSANLFMIPRGEIVVDFLENYKLTNPINEEFRQQVVGVLEGEHYKVNKIYPIFNNLLYSLLIICIFFIYSLFKKNYFFLCFSAVLLIHSSIIFISCPASFFMYYFPVYLSGILLGVIGLIKNLKKPKNLVLLFTILHFAATFFTDKLIFDFNSLNIFNYLFCKLIILFIIYNFWNFLVKFVTEKRHFSEIKYFLIYFIPVIFLLILVWPGFWTGSDVYNFINCNVRAEYLYYLNYITSIFNISSYMLIPTPVAPIIFQVLILSLILNYIAKKIFIITNRKFLSYSIFIPFFLPLTLKYVLYPNRPVIYGILYLLLIAMLIFDKITKQKLDISKLGKIIFLAGILSVFRTEGIYLVIAIPLIMTFVYSKSFNIKMFIKLFLIQLIVMIILLVPQKNYENKEGEIETAKRSLPSIVNPLSYMLTQELKGVNISEDIKKINLVLNVETLKKYNSLLDVNAMWSPEETIKDFNMDDYRTFKKAYIDIVKNNILLYLKCKTYTFYNATGFGKDFFVSYNLYSSNSDTILNYQTTKTLFDYKIRKNTLTIIEGRNYKTDQIYSIYKIFNNLLIPLILIFIAFMYSIFTKKITLFLISGMMLGHTLIVFLTAPASYFMYYFPIYLSGYLLGLILILLYFLKRNIKSEHFDL